MTRSELAQLSPATAMPRLLAAGQARSSVRTKRLVLVTSGGVRRRESFSKRGLINIPRLYGDLLPESIFDPHTSNEGVTSHFNTISGMPTGDCRHVDGRGSQRPTNPTLVHYLKSQHKLEGATVHKGCEAAVSTLSRIGQRAHARCREEPAHEVLRN